MNPLPSFSQNRINRIEGLIVFFLSCEEVQPRLSNVIFYSILRTEGSEYTVRFQKSLPIEMGSTYVQEKKILDTRWSCRVSHVSDIVLVKRVLMRGKG